MTERTINITLFVLSLILIACLILSMHRIGERNSRTKKFIRVLILFFAGSLCGLFSTVLMDLPGPFLHVLLLSAVMISYLIPVYVFPLLIGLLTNVKKEDFRQRDLKGCVLNVIWLLSSAEMILLICSLFNQIVFGISDTNTFVRGRLQGISENVILLQMLMMMWLCGKHTDNRIRKEPLRLICCMPAAAVIIGFFYHEVTFLYPLCALALLLIYVNVHLVNEQDLRRSEIELQENRLSILIGQIQPHFVFNVLNTIYYLCDSDPFTASRAARDFRLFLENNTSRMDYRGTVPFEQELENVMHYTSLEKLRFSEIEFIYEIHTKDFRIPPLTVQPLVENAVRHGCREMSTGRIIISASKTDNGYCVEVRDNGAGFQPKKTKDGKRHVGIENVNNRLSIISGASLVIEPLSPHGTSAKIFLPPES